MCILICCQQRTTGNKKAGPSGPPNSNANLYRTKGHPIQPTTNLLTTESEGQRSTRNVNPKFTVCQHILPHFRLFFGFSQKHGSFSPFFCYSEIPFHPIKSTAPPTLLPCPKNCCLKKCCHCERVAHTGRGNPPDEWNQGTITTKKRGSSHYSWCNSEHFPSNRGIATSLRSSQ